MDIFELEINHMKTLNSPDRLGHNIGNEGTWYSCNILVQYRKFYIKTAITWDFIKHFSSNGRQSLFPERHFDVAHCLFLSLYIKNTMDVCRIFLAPTFPDTPSIIFSYQRLHCGIPLERGGGEESFTVK